MAATRRETIAEFEARNREGSWELINGIPVELALSGGRAALTAARLGGHVYTYLLDHPFGYAFGADCGFVLFPDRDTVRAPDFAFVRRDRLPQIPDTFIRMPPDLAVEVLSPWDRIPDALAKTAMDLEAGVPLVWLIDPVKRTATVFRQDAAPLTIGEGDSLDGGDILPGFTLPLETLFG